MRIHSIVGARPNFMKIAPIHKACLAYPAIENRIVHTGQHYDDRMSGVFFKDLNLPEPDIYLGVGSGGHGAQTGAMMIAYEKIALEEKPDLVLVVGDVNSTLAAALVAVKLHIPVAHVEAGLRSFDRSMPEEINRELTDRISSVLFVTEEVGMTNLGREGVEMERCHLVGDVMYDTLRNFIGRAEAVHAHAGFGVGKKEYALVTLHRPANVDRRKELTRFIDLFERLPLDVLFPVHPRTRQRLAEFGLLSRIETNTRIRLIEPQGYIDFLSLVNDARLVLCDSGGTQSECSWLNVPCLMLRETTERPMLITSGTVELVGNDGELALRRVADVLAGRYKQSAALPFCDGRAAERIVGILTDTFR